MKRSEMARILAETILTNTGSATPKTLAELYLSELENAGMLPPTIIQNVYDFETNGAEVIIFQQKVNKWEPENE